MRVNFHTLSNVVVSTLALVACTGALAALPQRTFVASTGDDVNAAVSCRLTAPCRSFSVAIGQTRPGGEVIVLDSAGYGPVTITQAVSIIAPPGVYAGVSVSSGNGVTVDAGASDTVVLRGLAITGLGGTSGLVVNSAATVDVGHVEISGFSGDGIKFSGGGRLVVRDSIIRSNAGVGLSFIPAAGALLTVEGSSFDSNDIGVKVSGPVTASLRGSSATENPSGGIMALGGAVLVLADTRVAQIKTISAPAGIMADGAGSSLQAVRCEVLGYALGYYAHAGAHMQVVDSVATGGFDEGAGVYAVGAGSSVDAERSSVNSFNNGFAASAGGTLRVSASTATGVIASTGNDASTVYTRQNNMSGGTTFGAITPLSPF